MPNTLTQLMEVSRSGMVSRLLDLDSVSTNLANVNTIGYKANRLNFQEALSAASLNASIMARVSGTGARASQKLMNAGSLRQTEQPLDLAIQGDGFFAITLPDGRTAYTRDGSFTRDQTGQLVTTSGYNVVWNGTIPANLQNIHVNSDGAVMTQSNDIWTRAGQINLTRFANPNALEGYGENMWLETTSSGPAQAGTATAVGFGQIMGSYLENANVNLADEMSHMVVVQRAYSMSVRAFQQADQMTSLAISMRR